jgi:hypothetical protein
MSKLVRKGRTAISLGFVVFVFCLVGYLLFRSVNAAHRDQLFDSPIPTPAWIREIGPLPGSTLPVHEAAYGDTLPFDPALGTMCVQLDNALVGLSKPHSSKQVVFLVNGLPTYEPRPGFLMHGIVPKDGISMMAYSYESDSYFNACLVLILPPGRHWVRIDIPERGLSYSWAFELLEDTNR